MPLMKFRKLGGFKNVTSSRGGSWRRGWITEERRAHVTGWGLPPEIAGDTVTLTLTSFLDSI